MAIQELYPTRPSNVVDCSDSVTSPDDEQADFERDDVLRQLSLVGWFATAESDVPLWAFWAF